MTVSYTVSVPLTERALARRTPVGIALQWTGDLASTAAKTISASEPMTLTSLRSLVDAAADEVKAETTRGSLRSKAVTALDTNATYLALPTPTTAQAVAQVGALTRQVNALIRLVADQFDTTTGT